MRRIWHIIFLGCTIFFLLLSSCASEEVASSLVVESGMQTENTKSQLSNMQISERPDAKYVYAYIGTERLEILLDENSSAQAFLQMVENQNITIKMDDYGGFEKVGELPQSLPTNDQPITTEFGDVILYQGSSITIYYDTNSWDFTRIGTIQNIKQERLKQILGTGNITVVFSAE